MSIFLKKGFFLLNRSWKIGISGALVFVLVGMFSCKKDDNTTNELRLNMTVVDDLGSTINGAKIYIFDNQQVYESALGSGDFTTAKDSAISVAGGITFLLEGNLEHWCHIRYFDAGRNFLLSNTGDGKIEKLEKQSDINAKFFIAPITGNVTFWTDSQNKLPVNISFNGAPYSLNLNTAAAPTAPGDPNALTIQNVLAGSYQYSAVAANNCIWTGTVNVQRGGFHAIELTPCIRGRVTFIAPSYNPAHGPITVALDVNDVLTPSINSTGSYVCGIGSGAPTTSGGSFISVTREVNVNPYNYVARTQDGACAWTGSFIISGDTCIVINLPTCP